ncbi:hypothetical protein ACMFMG_005049 [Clarireedia jacksonii]
MYPTHPSTKPIHQTYPPNPSSSPIQFIHSFNSPNQTPKQTKQINRPPPIFPPPPNNAQRKSQGLSLLYPNPYKRGGERGEGVHFNSIQSSSEDHHLLTHSPPTKIDLHLHLHPSIHPSIHP